MNQLVSNDLDPTAIVLKKHQLPPLKYDHAALEPCIDTRTMLLHHDVHHGTYVEKLNVALEKFPKLQHVSALWLLCNLDQVPTAIRDAVHHNAGGHVNHSMFWCAMKPGASSEPTGLLHDAICRDFGSVAHFKTQFEEAGSKVFGSGWVWLVRSGGKDSKLEIMTTVGHDHPMMQERFPIVLNDVWEHAYYLKYESRRASYLKEWWSVTDWEQAARYFEMSNDSAEKIWDTENGQLPVIKP